MNWVATVSIHCAGLRSIAPADVWRDEVQRTAFSLFRAAHFLRRTQREPRPDSAGGISRHITALSIQRVLNPPGRQGSVALRRPLMR
ncbi:MAG: hypothetical protein ABSA90_18220 [Xanthobacteraceae bacterium]